MPFRSDLKTPAKDRSDDRRPRGRPSAAACAGSTLHKKPGQPNDRWMVNLASSSAYSRGSLVRAQTERSSPVFPGRSRLSVDSPIWSLTCHSLGVMLDYFSTLSHIESAASGAGPWPEPIAARHQTSVSASPWRTALSRGGCAFGRGGSRRSSVSLFAPAARYALGLQATRPARRRQDAPDGISHLSSG